MKKKKQTKMTGMFGVAALGTFVFATVLMIVGLSRTVVEIDQVAISHTPEAILASAGVSEEKDVFLTVVYYDQREDACVDLYDANLSDELYKRQFEWTECGYYNKDIEKGLVEYNLNEDYLPVAIGGKLTPNRGLNMDRWFGEIEGKSKSYTGNVKLQYKADGAQFTFHQNEFYPLDEADFSKDDPANRDGHNHLFTMNFAVPFTVLKSGNEGFEIVADDDTFVYVGDRLAIDMGGVHEATTGRFVINKDGEVYAAVQNEELAYTGINVGDEEGSIVRIFHADRDSSESVFKVAFSEMNLSLTDSKLANRKDEGLQIAYDPTDPSYVAPLGESKTVRPDGTRGYIIMATIEGVLIVVFSILITLSIRNVLRRGANKK